jgi:uncharacterized protein
MSTTDFSKLASMNPPLSIREQGGTLHVVTRDKTDFWRGTFYGFYRDDGHFLYTEAEGDFTAEVTFEGKYRELYDQAGLMVRIDEQHWIKTGIEYTDSVTHLSAVVTNTFSDWSVTPLAWAKDRPVTLRLTRHDTAFRIQYKTETGEWQMLRLAYLPRSPAVQIGLMCCSPQREGFEVIFHAFSVGPAIDRALHSG